MAIVASGNASAKVDRIYAHRFNGVDPKALRQRLAELARRGGITERDERLLEYLRELKVLSLDQVHRLLWAGSKRTTAYQRLSRISQEGLLSGARVPRAGLQRWGLPVCRVYALGPGGFMWLKSEVNRRQTVDQLRRDEILHNLLVAEVFVRMTEMVRARGESWSLTWAGERAASYTKDETPVIAPDGLAVVRQRQGDKTAALPLFLELDASRQGHGRLSSDWGRKVVGYDRFQASDWQLHPELGHLPTFPVVAVITHGAQRLLNLANAIRDHRREPVVYYLALWEDLLAGEDVLTAPAWLIITPEGQIAGWEREGRHPLLAVGAARIRDERPKTKDE